MDWNAPVSCECDFDIMGEAARIPFFLGDYDFRVYVRPGVYVEVGAGSLGCAAHVSHINPLAKGLLGSIGRYCEFADCSVMAAGEHDHDQPINIVFGNSPVLSLQSSIVGHPGLKPTPPISIGNGVVISSGAKVLPGVPVGDGAVIGAGAILTRPAEPFGIYVGLPAKLNRMRPNPPRHPWWNFSAAYLAGHLSDERSIAMADGPHEYRIDRPRFLLELKGGKTVLSGFVENGVERPLNEAPARVLAYLEQAYGPGPYYWLADCWAD